jgi:hypothetical protein
MERNEQQEEHGQGRLSRVGEQARTALERSREGMMAGASGVAETTRKVADRAGEQLGRAASIVRDAEPDQELRESVAEATERSVHRAGATLNRAAPTIGRGAELIADKAGAALHFAAGPLARIIGAMAGTLGGWWKLASEQSHSLPAAEDKACQAHFALMTVIPADLSYDRAKTGYALGYVAGRNPDYAGRTFDEVEGDLRTGFSTDGTGEYDRLRDFARYGYERGSR